jgi:hypothetical protein
LPRVQLMEEARAAGRRIARTPAKLTGRLKAPRAAIERGRANPRIGIAAIVGALVLIAWIAWATYVTSDHGVNAGLGVVIAWPALLGVLALVSLPFVGAFLLARRLGAGKGSAVAVTDEPEASPRGDGGEDGDGDPDENQDQGEGERDRREDQDDETPVPDSNASLQG